MPCIKCLIQRITNQKKCDQHNFVVDRNVTYQIPHYPGGDFPFTAYCGCVMDDRNTISQPCPVLAEAIGWYLAGYTHWERRMKDHAERVFHLSRIRAVPPLVDLKVMEHERTGHFPSSGWNPSGDQPA